tara:strand:+ start:261 stop:671 length:411 start_codon:yes stop_codon:yes gene_type:complete
MDIEPRQKQFDFDGPETIKPEVLETFPYASQGDPLDVDIDTDEFTAVCPWTGLPDFGEVVISYVPNEVLLELRSYKYYLLSYRTVGMVQEQITRRIMDDLVEAVRPIRMLVRTNYRIRGGIHTVCTAEYDQESSDL